MCAFIGSTFCLTFDVDSSFEESDSLSDMLAPGFASCAPMSSILSRMLDGEETLGVVGVEGVVSCVAAASLCLNMSGGEGTEGSLGWESSLNISSWFSEE